MTSYIAAIVSRYQVATAITANGPWLDLAPDDQTTYPHGIIQIMPGKYEPYFGTEYDDVFNVRFILSDDNLADLITAQSALHTRFDRHKLAVNGTSKMVRQNFYVNTSGVVDKVGVKVYRSVSDYRFLARQTN